MAIAIAHVSARGMASAPRSNVTSAVTAPKCKPAVTRTCTVPVSWNSARSAGGIAARSPHNSPDTTEAAGSPNRRRSCSCAQACARASHVRASPVAFGSICENRRTLEPAVHAALGLDRAFARLAGIARLVERFQTTANQHARTGRYVFAHASGRRRTVVEGESHLAGTVGLLDAIEQRRGIARRSSSPRVSASERVRMPALRVAAARVTSSNVAKARRPAVPAKEKEDECSVGGNDDGAYVGRRRRNGERCEHRAGRAKKNRIRRHAAALTTRCAGV